MAFKFSAGDDSDLPVNHDINVTPFIDVMLVLLIIFMVAAPLATVDVKVDLPVSTATPSPKPDKPIFLTIQESGALLVNERAVSQAELGAAVKAAAGDAEGQRIYLRADKTVPYERIMDAMNALRSSGHLQIALVGLEGGTGQ